MHDRPRRGGSRGSDRFQGGRGGRPPREDRPRDDRPRDERPRGERIHPAPYPERPRPTFAELFRTGKPLIGCVHLKPLPGSPGYDGHFLDLLDAALNDARSLEEGGVAGIIVENFGDAPFYPDNVPPETIAVMTRLVTEIRKAVRVPVGVNVLRNDARAGVAVAAATGAGFVRVNVHTGAMVTDQGVIAGRAHESVRLREVLRSRTLLLADVRVKHAAPLAELDIVDEAEDAVLRGHADALIITGAATGRKADLALVAELKARLPKTAILVGSGVTLETIEEVLAVADGCIVGTALKFDGDIAQPVERRRVRAMADIADRVSPRQVFERSYERAQPTAQELPTEAPVTAERPAEEAPVAEPRAREPRPAAEPRRAPTRRATPPAADAPISWKEVGTPVEGAPPYEQASVHSDYSAAPAADAPGGGEEPGEEFAPAPWFDKGKSDSAAAAEAPAAPAPAAAPPTAEEVAFGRAPVRKARRR